MSKVSTARAYIENLLTAADVRIGGSRHHDITVHDERLFPTVLSGGSLALGESYMDGWWDCARLDEFFFRVLHAGLDQQLHSWSALTAMLKTRLTNPQTAHRAVRVARQHYDLGNDLFQAMLDRRLIYSGAYWEGADSLEAAQEAKLDLVCRKLGLREGMRVLDIGCGFGGAAQFAAERYGVEVVGVTISQEQARLARELCRGLPVEIRQEGYRSLRGVFDRIFSLGMFEHVGPKNYATFFEVVRRLLREEDGLFLLQSIGVQAPSRGPDPWLARYIFPNSQLPAAAQVMAAAEERLVMEDWQNLGAHYDNTLLHWHHRLEENWGRLQHRYDRRFQRMWRYYLLSCAGAFRARTNQLWQIVFSPRGVPGGYSAVRS